MQTGSGSEETVALRMLGEQISDSERARDEAVANAEGLERLLDAFATIARTRTLRQTIAVSLRAARNAIGFSRAYFLNVQRHRSVEATYVIDAADVVEPCAERPEDGENSALLGLLRGDRLVDWGAAGDLSAPFPDVRGWYALAALRRGATTHGAIYADGHPSAKPSRRETRAVGALAAITAIAIDNAANFDRAHELATRDTLTGLLNRRGLAFRLSLEMERARSGRPFSYVLIDADDFKGINDSRGHRYGDSVLIRIARALMHASRTEDVVARFAGDEFVVLLSGADRTAAQALVVRLARALIADGLRCSLGISVFPDDARDGERLFAAADRALYAAKAAGKNGYSFADGSLG